MKEKNKSPKPNRKTANAERNGPPVTLAQVKAMVRVPPTPRRALRTKGGGAGTTASLATIGIEKKQLRFHQRHERKARIRDYREMMRIMKKRGVKGLLAKTDSHLERRTTGTTKAVPSAAPLQILAEGDSWFDYPVPLFGGGIIPRLEDRLGVPILNLAKAGDEVRYMLGVEERKITEKQLSDGCPAGGPWDVLLFSGGGNDIVDNPMALWVRDFNPTFPAEKLIHQPRYAAALSLIQAGYEDLITLRDTLSPSTHLVFHAYDFAIPDGRGVCFLGPWLKPTFDLHKFPAGSTIAFQVVKEMLKQFAVLLQTLENNHERVTFINGQGTLTPNSRSWHNELHPSKNGFNKFADIFHNKLKTLFPNRVL